ncbi:MAG: ATP-binding cassette domain-containing protein [Methanomicrobiales archaeon]|jgi:energy-coupling factor transport system ATP-binding protein
MRAILDDVIIRRGSFQLEASGTFSEGVHLVTGPVGSGKSTLALALEGALLPVAGRIGEEGIRSRILSLPFPEYHITGDTLAGEAASWGLLPASVLKTAGLSGRGGEDVLRCSQGELKRLVLSCILAWEWDLLILDEPYSSLDCAWKESFSRRLGERREGITIIFTHEDEILPRVDELWEIQAGRLVSLGRVPEAIRRWSRPPRYIRAALDKGIIPENITPGDVRDALCRTPG